MMMKRTEIIAQVKCKPLFCMRLFRFVACFVPTAPRYKWGLSRVVWYVTGSVNISTLYKPMKSRFNY